MTVLSFHPVKHITTGEGGAVLTNKKEYYEKLLMFRNHGITKDKTQFKNYNNLNNYNNYSISNNLISDLSPWYYEMQFLGYNYRMTDIQAALGISQLKKLDSFVEKRRAIAETYHKAFRDNPYFDIPLEEDYACSSYHLYPIRLKDNYRVKKKEIFENLREKEIGAQVHYIPVYLQPYYQDMGYRKGTCPVAEDFYRREISIPMYPAIRDKDIDCVIDKIRQIFNLTNKINIGKLKV